MSNTAIAVAFATFFSVASAAAPQFGTAEEARAMLDHAVAALKSDEAKALRDFNDTKNKLFHDRDLYISCFDTSDGKFTAFPGPGMTGIEAIQGTPEETLATMEYNFPKGGKPAVKQSLQTRVGNQGCGVSYYK